VQNVVEELKQEHVIVQVLHVVVLVVQVHQAKIVILNHVKFVHPDKPNQLVAVYLM
jgi:hypothetical protein